MSYDSDMRQGVGIYDYFKKARDLSVNTMFSGRLYL